MFIVSRTVYIKIRKTKIGKMPASALKMEDGPVLSRTMDMRREPL